MSGTHACDSRRTSYFRDKPAQRGLYEAFLKFVEQFGPVTVNVTKSRISFQGRVRFGGVSRTTRDGIVCRFWLKREIHSARLMKTELVPPHDYIHQFKLTDPRELDAEVASWLEEAYQVGMQRSV